MPLKIDLLKVPHFKAFSSVLESYSYHWISKTFLDTRLQKVIIVTAKTFLLVNVSCTKDNFSNFWCPYLRINQNHKKVSVLIKIIHQLKFSKFHFGSQINACIWNYNENICRANNSLVYHQLFKYVSFITSDLRVKSKYMIYYPLTKPMNSIYEIVLLLL